MTINQFSKDKKAKVVANGAGHGSAIGATVTLKSVLNGYIKVKENSWNYLASDLELLPLTKNDLKSQLNTLKKETEEIEKKLAFIEENNLEEFNETTFKTLSTIKLLGNKKLTDIEKAKLISSLIEGN